MKPLVMMRSHIYNDHVKMAFARLREFSNSLETVLLLDVSKGDITPDAPALKFNGTRLQKIGLELYPEDKWAWFAGDYALYCAFLERSECSHFFMIDYDAYVNFSVEDLMGRVMEADYDLVASYAGFENEDWMWTAAGRHWFSRVVGCFFPLVVVSRRLILRCLEFRLAQSRELPTDKADRAMFLQLHWVNCEAFVPSVALSSEYSIVDIQTLIPGWTYECFRDLDVMHWDMPEIKNVPCAHPVFLKADLPRQIQMKLKQLPNGATRTWFIKRITELLRRDESLWSAITYENPELLMGEAHQQRPSETL